MSAVRTSVHFDKSGVTVAIPLADGPYSSDVPCGNGCGLNADVMMSGPDPYNPGAQLAPEYFCDTCADDILYHIGTVS